MRSLNLESLEPRVLLSGNLTGNVDLDTGTGTGPDGVVRILGQDASDMFGGSVACVGDVNNDGYDDLVVGAYGGDPSSRSEAGEAYLILGRADEDWADFDLDAATLPDGVFAFWGDDAGDRFGVRVAGAGDVNDDGYDDIVVGAYTASPSGRAAAGEAFIILGRGTGDWADLDMDDNPEAVFRISGAEQEDYTGISVAGVGDVDGDGYDDVAIGAYGIGEYDKGGAYVVFGRETGDWDDLDLGGTPDSVARITGDDGADYAGWSVAGAGDVDDDGFDDILVGAFGAEQSGEINAGETYLIFGRSPALWGDVDLDTGTGTGPERVIRILGDDTNDRSGTRVAGVGDVDDDGYDDFVVGAQFATPLGGSEAGITYLIFGRDRDDWDDVDLSTSGQGVVKIYGDDVGDHSSVSLSGAGDVNDDGYDDFLIGAYDADPSGGNGAGEAYLVLGRPTGDWTNLNLNVALGPAGVIRIFGDDEDDSLGGGVGGGGDLNGDGYDDILVGAAMADPDGRGEAGEAYVIFGGTTPAQEPDLAVDNVLFGQGIYAAGTDLDVGLRLSNLGSAEALAPFCVDVYLSLDTEIGNGDDVLVGRYEADEAMSAFTQANLLVAGEIPDATDWGDYYLAVVADPLDQVFEGNETNNVWWSAETTVRVEGDMKPVGQIRSGTVLVSVYDLSGPADIDPDNIQVKFDGNSISSIKLTGYQSMDGLGIVISGADYVGKIKDGRKGDRADIAFIAADAPIGKIKLKSGMDGYNLNGLTLGGLDFPDDIDGDGAVDDLTALCTPNYIGSLKTDRAVNADIWLGGQDGKGRSLGSLKTKYGGYHGDLVATGDVGKVKLGAGLGSGIYVGGSISKMKLGGSLNGAEIDAAGGLSKLKVSGGMANSTIEAWGISKVQFGGNVTDSTIGVATEMSKLKVSGGMAGTSIEAYAVSKLQFGGGVAGSTITTDAGLSKMKIGASLIDTQIEAGDELSKMDVRGNWTDSTLLAAELGKIKVRGDISSTTGPDDMIRASTGAFYVYELGEKHAIFDAAGMWFDDVHACVSV